MAIEPEVEPNQAPVDLVRAAPVGWAPGPQRGGSHTNPQRCHVVTAGQVSAGVSVRRSPPTPRPMPRPLDAVDEIEV